jgi:hypothetical protein
MDASIFVIEPVFQQATLCTECEMNPALQEDLWAGLRSQLRSNTTRVGKSAHQKMLSMYASPFLSLLPVRTWQELGIQFRRENPRSV